MVFLFWVMRVHMYVRTFALSPSAVNCCAVDNQGEGRSVIYSTHVIINQFVKTPPHIERPSSNERDDVSKGKPFSEEGKYIKKRSTVRLRKHIHITFVYCFDKFGEMLCEGLTVVTFCAPRIILNHASHSFLRGGGECLIRHVVGVM